MDTIRVLISLVINLDWKLKYYDIENAFFYGDLNEENLLANSFKYENIRNNNKVCKVKKYLYGL